MSSRALGRWVLVMSGMLVRRSGMASLTRRRGDLTSETQHSEEEESDPVWAFPQLRRLGFGLMAVSHANLMGLIRIARLSAHPSNDTGDRFLPLFVRLSVGCPLTPGWGDTVWHFRAIALAARLLGCHSMKAVQKALLLPS